jgi:signal transduction histidine kinase
MIESPSLLAQDCLTVPGPPPQTSPDGHFEIDRLKSAFVNTLVRDIRLPLSSILRVLELLEGKIQAHEAFDLEDRQLLSSAIENGDRIRQMVDDLLEIARQHERPLDLTLETVQADQLLKEVAEPLRGESALRGVDLNVEIVAPSLQLQVDRGQARRALCHLLKAALAATPDGGSVSMVANEIISTRAGEEGRRFVVISVSDSSEGIPPEEAPFIFDAFWQTRDSRGSTGRGVGLSIAKRIAAAHGGNVSVRSNDGKGATYSIVFFSRSPEH